MPKKEKEAKKTKRVAKTKKAKQGTKSVKYIQGFDIESGIPVAPRQPTGGFKYPWHLLNKGDSFFVPEGEAPKTFTASVYTRNQVERKSKGKTKKFVVRRVDGGHRVWRVK